MVKFAFILALCWMNSLIITATPSPTLYQPPDYECSAPQYSDHTDWFFDSQSITSFLDEDDNLFWIKLYEPLSSTTQRLLFDINTDSQFASRFDHILFTTDIYGNFNQAPNYFITNINPKFFITTDSSYIGISFDNNTVAFTATSCDGSSAIPSAPLPSNTTSISYITGSNIANTSFGGSHIQISVQSNRTTSTTLVVVKWTDANGTIDYQSLCTYNSILSDDSNIVIKTLSATDDDYYRFSYIQFRLCSSEWNTASKIYCEEDDFFSIISSQLWQGTLTSAYENITINGVTEQYHGLFNKEGQSNIHRTVTNIAPNENITISFTFLAIKTGTKNRAYSFLYGPDVGNLVAVNHTFSYTDTYCPNNISHTNISGTSIDGSIDDSTLICMEHYAVNITSSSDTLIIEFDNDEQGTSNLYFGFNHLCLTADTASTSNVSQVTAYTSLAPTPAPTDFNYRGCPLYKSELSDYIVYNGTDINALHATNNGVYTFSFSGTPSKTSEWLLSAPTHIAIHNVSSSLSVTVNTAKAQVSCRNPILVIKGSTRFISVRFTPQSVGFYPFCDDALAFVPLNDSIHKTYIDPARNITYDTNNIIWSEQFSNDIDPNVVLINDMDTKTTTVYVQRELKDTGGLVDFTCKWNETFAADGIMTVLLASSTLESCRINDITTTYCDLEWHQPLDFCEDVASNSYIALWNQADTITIAQKEVHGAFTNNHTAVNAVYYKLSPHQLVDIYTTFYITGSVLNSTDIIEFEITADEDTTTIAHYAGDNDANCATEWINVTHTYCAVSTVIKNINHTSHDMHINISMHVINGSTPFHWAFSGLCMNQTFRITKSPTPAPTNMPSLPTSAPTDAPSQPPTLSPSGSPSQPPTNAPSSSPTAKPSSSPSQPPTNAPSHSPTFSPSGSPSQPPTKAPSGSPTQPPSNTPSQPPTNAPSGSPSQPPTNSPSSPPTNAPSSSPSQPPTNAPSISPTFSPSSSPSQPPTNAPSGSPSQPPTNTPSQPPTNAPSGSPSQPPTNTPSQPPTNAPSGSPSQPPSGSPSAPPTNAPSGSPSQAPSTAPSVSPTSAPTNSPSQPPSTAPTEEPSNSPSQPPSSSPSSSPTDPPTNAPSFIPSHSPTQAPSISPSAAPSESPSGSPSQPPTKAPSGSPTLAPSSAPTEQPTFSTRNPSMDPSVEPTVEPTSDPSVEPSDAPTASPTAAPIADNEEKSQLQMKDTNGFCNMDCWQCLQQIDVIGNNRLWAMTFRTSNITNCECPKANTVLPNDNNKSIDISLVNPVNTLKMYKYVINENNDESDDDDDDDDDTQNIEIQYGIRVDVLYWMDVRSNCSVSYYVNQNKFFGVHAQNVLTIIFTICDVAESELEDNIIREAEISFAEEFAELFDVDITRVNASIIIGSFCDNENRRRLLQNQADNDQEVTIVIVFADAADARAAEENACEEAAALEDIDSCSVLMQSESELAAATIVSEKEVILGLSTLELALVIVAIVIAFLFIFVACYTYESYKKRKSTKLLNRKYHQQRKNTGEDVMRGAVSRSPMLTAVSSEDGTRKRIKSKVEMREKKMPAKTVLSNVNVSNVVQNTTHVHVRNESIEVESISSSVEIRATQLAITNTQETHGTDYMETYRIETGDDGNSCVVHHYDDVDYLHDIAENEVVFREEYKSEQEMIEEVIKSRKANEIKQEEVVMEAQIGRGQFGAVFKAKWEGNIVVVKQLNAERKSTNEYESQETIEKMKKEKLARAKEMKAEIILASSIPTHNNLVEIYGYIRNPFGVVMSFMPGDSVQKYVYRCYKKEKQAIPSILEILIILGKAASGLKFLHEHGLVHRDIACRNILLGRINNNRIDTLTEVRISDFGLTRELANKSSDDFIQKTQSSFGPLKWMAPESIKSKQYSKKSDVYMFAITMWEIFYGKEPYTNTTAVNVAISVVTKKNRPRIVVDAIQYKHSEMPDGYQYLMENCWHQQPQKRPNFTQILCRLSKVASNPVRRAP